MAILAKQAGLIIENIVFDSTDFQFWASEQYKMDIPLNDPRSYAVDPLQSIFTGAQIEHFKKMAAELNMQKKATSYAFTLGKNNK